MPQQFLDDEDVVIGLQQVGRIGVEKVWAVIRSSSAASSASSPFSTHGPEPWNTTPNVHMLVPAGGLDKDGQWEESRKYLVPVQALSRGFRYRFMDMAKKALPKETLPKEVWDKEWVVFCKPTFNRAKKVLPYLGRYVHRIAISNNRILSLENGTVTFRYQNSDTRQWKTMPLPAKEFLRRYLQHVLPQGFHKVRYHGLFSPRNRVTLKRLQLLLAERIREKAANSADTPDPPKAERRCPCCEEGIMVTTSWLPRKARSPPQGRAAATAQ